MTQLNKEEEEQAHLARMTGWLAKMTPEERKRYCDHGHSAVLAFMCCKYCMSLEN